MYGPRGGNPDEILLAGAKSNVGPLRSMSFERMDKELVLAPKGKGANLRLMTTVGRLVCLSDNAKGTWKDVLAFDGDFGSGGKANNTPEPVKAMAKELLIALLLGGPMTVADLQDEVANAKVSWATIRRAADQMADEGFPIEKKRVGFGKGGYWTWALPANHPAMIAAGVGPLPIAGA
jgi:hypothetical protein